MGLGRLWARARLFLPLDLDLFNTRRRQQPEVEVMEAFKENSTTRVLNRSSTLPINFIHRPDGFWDVFIPVFGPLQSGYRRTCIGLFLVTWLKGLHCTRRIPYFCVPVVLYEPSKTYLRAPTRSLRCCAQSNLPVESDKSIYNSSGRRGSGIFSACVGQPQQNPDR